MDIKFASDKVAVDKKESRRILDKVRKRVKRLEENGLTDSPAYQQLLNSGGTRFSIRGKDRNGFQREIDRAKKFLDSITSTIRGYDKVLKNTADIVGIKYHSIKELRQISKPFFDIFKQVCDSILQYDESLVLIHYNVIWETMNVYIEQQKLNLAEIKPDIYRISEKITEILKYELIEKGYEGYKEDDGSFQFIRKK